MEPTAPVPSKTPSNKNTKIIIAVVVSLVVVIVVAGLLFALSKRENKGDEGRDAYSENGGGYQNDENGDSESSYDTTPPVLKNLAVEFGPYDSATKTAGDFLFTQNALQGHLKGFFEFGALIVGGSEKKVLPNLEYESLVEGTKLVAVADGFVVNVRSRSDSNDYTVHTLVKENSVWEIAYDHVIDPQVERGDTIKAGDVIGQVAQQGNGLFRSELQIQHTENGVTTYVCPLTLLDPAVKDEFDTKIATLQKDWEAFAGRDLYNEADQPIAGCNYETLTDAKMEELTR